MNTMIRIDGVRRNFITQQYITGLYLAIYNADNPGEMPEQGGINTQEEAKFHLTLRKYSEKKGDEVLYDQSTVLPEKIKRKKK